MYKVGQRLRVAKNNDNECYDRFRNEILVVHSISTSKKDHPGYDEAMNGEPLYDLETLDGRPIGNSLYHYELEKVK